MKMKNRRRSAKHKTFYTVLLVLTILLVAGCQKKMTVQDYLDLGEKYLTEANYEKAIIAFTKAIEVEPKALKAYEGLTNAYIKTENYEKAQEALETGISVYEGLAAEEQIDEFRQIYEALLSLKDEVEVYLREENNVQDDQEDTEVSDADKERLIAEAKEKYGDILDQIIESLDSGTLEPTCYYAEDFIDFVNSLETPLYWQIDDGRYVGLYSTGDGIYLGEMKNGLRSGWGFFYTENNWDSVSQLWLYTGSWSEDYPNGLGTYESVSMSSGDVYGTKTEGNYHNGYENGTMHKTYSGADYNHTFTYNATDGIPQVISDTDGAPIVAITTDTTGYEVGLQYDADAPWGIEGAMKN